MIKHIVELGSDLQSHLFVYMNSFSERDVLEVRTWTTVIVSRQEVAQVRIKGFDAGKGSSVRNARAAEHTLTNAVCGKIQKTIRKLRVLRHLRRCQHTRQGSGDPRPYGCKPVYRQDIEQVERLSRLKRKDSADLPS